MDVAATLEVRGFADAHRAPRRSRPWSRHDLAFLASAVAVLALACVGRIGGVAAFAAYPLIRAALGLETVALCAAIATVALLPFADRRGIAP